jgi:glycine/D-amino acid oxidase-like deaminating enzyme
MRQVDAVVVGQGLAGTCLAWRVWLAGRNVYVIDPGEIITASRIAAGLITPITGRRFTVLPEWSSLWQAALDFYRDLEVRTAATFLHVESSRRAFQSADERAAWEERCFMDDGSPAAVLCDDWSSQVRAPFGGFAMSPAARLDVARFLEVSRETFQTNGLLIEARLDLNEVEPGRDRCRLPSLGLSSRSIFFCEGASGRGNPWFPNLSWLPAKGEILTVAMPGLSLDQTLHGGIWLAPQADGTYRAGATFDPHRLDSLPTPEGRAELLAKLARLVDTPAEVLVHDAAIRPALSNQQPVIRRNPDWPSLWLLNGLGARGSLLAPTWSARLFAQWSSPESQPRSAQRPQLLTRLAHQILREQVPRGTSVIDATAGNGHDTLALAEIVGPDGHVLAIDIQPVAVMATRSRIENSGHANVMVVEGDHAEMARWLPTEWPGRVAAVVFNLGYLPGGDHSRLTSSESTITALEAAACLLAPDGIITVMAYPGHAGGADELSAVVAWLKGLDGDFTWSRHEGAPGRSVSPVLFVIRRSG